MRQERERPSPVNRRNSQAACCMTRSKYQMAPSAVKAARPRLRRGATRSALTAPRLEHEEYQGYDCRDGEAVVGEDTQAMIRKVVEQEPYRQVSHERRSDKADPEQ